MAFTLKNQLFQIFLPNRKDFYSLLTVISGALINFILNMILIPKWSYYGACISTLIAEFSVMLVSLILTNQSVPKFFSFFKYIYQYIIASIVMAGVILIEQNIIHIDSLYLIIIEITTGIFIYFLILLFLKNKYLSFILHLKNKR